MISIKSELLNINIKNAGAELCNVIHRANKLEYIWQAGPEWPKHSPILFPIVGQLKNDCYQWGDKTYSLPRHGFARNMPFQTRSINPDSATFEISSNDETLHNYPFHFTLQIHYFVQSNVLTVTYTVINNGSGIMPFSIGAHPAFKVPLLETDNYDDYYLQFNQSETAPRWVLESGLLSHAIPFLNEEQTIPLTKKLFNEDALVFKHLRSESVLLKSRKHQHGLKCCFSGFPYLGLWAAKNANFVCIEPWHGIADSVDATGLLEKKEGIVLLHPKQTWRGNYKIDFF
jgi:galactose mutarotase-like enzyme